MRSLSVVTTFQERKRQKRLQYEKKLLRELSLKVLQEHVKEQFNPYVHPTYVYYLAIEDGCIDVAIESYLLGASFSRFGHFGESVNEVKERSYQEMSGYIDYLYDFINTWLGKTRDMSTEDLYFTCESYINYWWEKGFLEGLKKIRLRLH
ncbi:DUF2521 family protein [Lottiidibacillus patelloidae]|uniref:DUF2521 family protein n=1 Tax=Lottiidibacillus patelloidae TaxID=2670334 RepID=UPI001E29609D|nr:DUF2521 family protein [Lottiidibacillus patelloidae]